MSRQLKRVSWLTIGRNHHWRRQWIAVSRLTLLALMLSFPLLARAAEAPGALTFIVTNEDTDRPLADVRVIIKERETGATQAFTTDAEGRIIAEQLDPGLYAVNLSKSGFASSYEPSLRVVTRKNIKVEFELKEEDIEEVLILGQEAEAIASVNGTYLDREALRSAVGGGADPLLGLDGLPGLASSSEFAAFSVRGRGPRDNLLFVDDFPFDKAVHFDATLGEQEDVGGGGRFSIFAPNVISGAEFSPGGWGAAYGGRAASLLKLEVADGNPSPSASFRYDLAGYEVGYDGPTGITEDSTMLISARQLDFGDFFETIEELDIGAPVLRDIIVKSVMPINSDHTVEILLMDTHEDYTRGVDNVFASPNFEDTSLQDSEQDSDLYGATLRSLIGDQAVWTNKIYYRKSDKVSSEGEAYPDLVPEGSPASSYPVREDIITVGENETEIGWRSDFETVNRWGVLTTGLRVTQIELDYSTVLDGDWNRFIYDQDDFRPDPNQFYIVLTPESINSSLNQKETSYVGYIDQVFELGDWDVRTGVRFEQDGFADESFASPRFSVNWRPDNRIRYFSTAGVFHQSPRYLELAANEANDLKTEEITHSSIGFEYFPSNSWSVLVEAYYQILDDLVVDLDRTSETFANIGEGTSYGVDFVVNGTILEGLYATATYSYNDAVIDRKDGRGEVADEFSREHVATLGLTWEINDRWKVAGSYKFLSGRPDDEFIVHSDVLGAGQPLRYSKEITARSVGRKSGSGTLNIRVDYRRAFGAIDVTTFLDIINVTATSSSDDTEFDYRRGIEVEDDSEAEPLIGLRLDYAW
ncbi:TonB-dependent receptor [Gilvimarinus algae]|uniref:TonB-dependent receptor n=1 Tax=Gilvimarinus algae TaxID=3058037 RepID=A0ABT8TE78_9GAMM|nr:TonB-dependent receptor [Gilvimarinus sp. SDUM040014]MDO3382417.1 TonB-dependent receptor [Gilvimarinus sp. SDUM040014]